MFLLKKTVSIYFVLFICYTLIITIYSSENPANSIVVYLLFTFIASVAIGSLIQESSLWLIPLLLVCIIIFAGRCYYTEIHYKTIKKQYTDVPQTFAGYVTTYSTNSGKYTLFTCKILYIKKHGDFYPITPITLLVKSKGSSTGISRWQSVILSGRIKIYDNYARAGFNYQHYLRSHGLTGTLQPTVPITILRQRFSGIQFLQPFCMIRNKILTKLQKKLQLPVYAFIVSIFFGDRSLLPEETENTFRATGMIHLLAISGFHIGFIGSLFCCFFARICPRDIARYISTVILACYMLLLNTSASSIRAFLMYTLQSHYFIWGKKTGKLTPLSMTGVFMLLYNPYVLYDTGFILSFTATAGILLYSDMITKLLPQWLPAWISSSFSVTFAAFGSIATLQMVLFGRLPLFALISSIAVVPLFTGLFTILFISVPLLVASNSRLIAETINFAVTFFINVIFGLSHIPSFTAPQFPAWFPYFLTGLLFTIFYMLIPFTQKIYRIVKKKILIAKQGKNLPSY